MTNCNCCGKPLNRSFTSTDGKMKSCPRCSTTHGSMHVFHHDPEGFGTTPARVSPTNPDGIQSYCVDCRTLEAGEDSKVFSNYPTCDQI